MTTSKVHPVGCDMMIDNNDAPSSPRTMPSPTDNNVKERMDQIDRLKYFLATATENWDEGAAIKRFRLPNGEDMSCVLWNDLFYITGTDIVRSLSFRFHAFGRPVTNAKKFEEGIFSDLRNLKPGTDARLEEPKSELLDMLYKNNCIRTQKKQKVFYWYSVPHDRLFLDALERDLKREKMDMEPTTVAVAEPATSISLDSTQELFDQLRKNMSLSAAATAHALEDEAARYAVPQQQQQQQPAPTSGYWNGWNSPHHHRSSRCERSLAAAAPTTGVLRRSRVNSASRTNQQQQLQQQTRHHYHHLSHAGHTAPSTPASRPPRVRHRTASATSTIAAASSSTLSRPKLSAVKSMPPGSRTAARAEARRTNNDIASTKSLDSNVLKKKKAIFGTLSLFDGSPTYKQRRRRATSASSTATATSCSSANQQHLPATNTSTNVAADGDETTCHQLSASSPSNCQVVSTTNATQPSSHLAMAAVAAGFTGDDTNNRNDDNMITAEVSTTSTTPNVLANPTTGWSPIADTDNAYVCATTANPGVTTTATIIDSFDLQQQHHSNHAVPSTSSCAFDTQPSLVNHTKLFSSQKHTPSIDMMSNVSATLAHEEEADTYMCETVPSTIWSSSAAAAAAASGNGSLCSSRCSTLSPILDLDLQGGGTSSYLGRSRTNSTSEDDSSSSSLTSSPSLHLGYHPIPNHHQLAPPEIYDWMGMTDDAHRVYAPTRPLGPTPPPVTLFSPCKPDDMYHSQQHFMQQQQQQQSHDNMYPIHDTTETLMPTFGNDLMYNLQDSTTAPTTTTSNTAHYAPSYFVAPRDVSMAMF